MKKLLALNIIILFISCVIYAKSPSDASEKNIFKFKNGDFWKIEEIMIQRTADQAGKLSTNVIRSEIEFRVMRVFPDSSAFVSKRILKVENGTSFDNLTAAQMKPEFSKAKFILLTAKGETYAIQDKPVFTNPEEAEAAKQSGLEDEVAILKSAKDTKEFFAKSRSPIDSYKIPPEKLKIGASIKKDGWVIKLETNDITGNVISEVYSAVLEPVTEITWFNSRDGYVLKRKLTQKGVPSIEVLQVRKR